MIATAMSAPYTLFTLEREAHQTKEPKSCMGLKYNKSGAPQRNSPELTNTWQLHIQLTTVTLITQLNFPLTFSATLTLNGQKLHVFVA